MDIMDIMDMICLDMICIWELGWFYDSFVIYGGAMMFVGRCVGGMWTDTWIFGFVQYL